MNYSSFKEKAYIIIRKKIISNGFTPGQPLNERELSERLKISKTPIREAIQLLHKEGLVTFFPHKGAFVTTVTLDDVKELIQIREGIEPLAAGIAADNNNEDSLFNFEKELKSIAEGQPRDYKVMREVGMKFHAYLIKSTGNHRLMELHHSLDGQVFRARNLFHAKIPLLYYDRCLTEHIDILEEVKRGNVKASEEVMRAHIKGYWEILKEAG